MRLSDWRAAAPTKDAASPRVLAVVEPILAGLGAEKDPHCWVAWGDDPATRWTAFVPSAAGLIATHVRVNVPGEGPRASVKLIRWSRVQVGELGVESQGGHRLLSFQVEQTVVRGVDAEADAASAFALLLFAAIDGRPLPDLERIGGGGRRPAPKPATTRSAAKATIGRATTRRPPARP